MIPYTILGAGAIGGTLAVRLSQAEVPVQVVDVDEAHVTAINTKGLTLVTSHGTHTERVKAYTLANAPTTLEKVILAVKAQATDTAMDWLTPRLAVDGFVVSMQNGLNEASIAAHVGADRTIAAFVDLFADVLEPSIIQDGGNGAMALGEYAGPNSDRVRRLAEDLHKWGKPVVSTNVEGFLWSKLGFGAMLTATALVDADMGKLIDEHRDLMLRLAREVFDIAEHLNIQLERFDAFRPNDFTHTASAEAIKTAFDDLCAWLQTQTKKRSGIWRDIAVRHRPTEVSTHYRPVLDLAERFGVATPLLSSVVERIGWLENGQTKMGLELLTGLGTSHPREA